MADIADDLLPVFPFRINWRGGLSERLEWRTDVLSDLLGNEQRQALRLTPRREFEATLTVWDSERTFLDLWLHRLGDSECLFPLWHDSVRAEIPAAQGQKTIRVDTRGLEFKIGSYALLRGLTAMSFERVQIAEVHADRIVTAANLVRTWPKGTRLEPLIRGRLTPETKATLHGSRAAEAQIVLQATRDHPYAAGVESSPVYGGLPVLTTGPNRVDTLDLEYLWRFHEADSQTGRRYRKSDSDRPNTSQRHTWLLKGRTAKAEFRSFIYRLRGALMPMWVPTFSDDLKLAQDVAAGATSIYVEEIGFAYTGGVSPGREHIAIRTAAGWVFRRITGTAAAPAGQERLVLDAALPAAIRRREVRSISWMDTARMENDRVEFVHVNAADGATTVAAVFKSFRNGRTPPVNIVAAIPATEKSGVPCGVSGGVPWSIKVRVRRVNGQSFGGDTFLYDAHTGRSVFPHGNGPDFKPVGFESFKNNAGENIAWEWTYWEYIPSPIDWSLRLQNVFAGSTGGLLVEWRRTNGPYTLAVSGVSAGVFPADFAMRF